MPTDEFRKEIQQTALKKLRGKLLNPEKLKEKGGLKGVIIAASTLVTEDRSSVLIYVREDSTGDVYVVPVQFTELTWLCWRYGIYPGQWVGGRVECSYARRLLSKNGTVVSVIQIKPEYRRKGKEEE
ncbi:MAG: hypothetical protein QXO86_07715 [Nitrososphaerota archaeon]